MKAHWQLPVTVLVLCGVWLCAGCTQSFQDPEAMLDEALSAFEAQHRTVEAEQTGEVIIRSVRSDWHPLRDIRQFRNGIQEVSFDKEHSELRTAVLNVKLNPESAKAMLSAQLIAQLSQIDNQQDKLAGSDLDNGKDNQVMAAIAERVQAAQEELTHMLSQIDVQSNVLIWVEQGSHLPRRMRWNNAIQHMDEEANMETWSLDYQITG